MLSITITNRKQPFVYTPPVFNAPVVHTTTTPPTIFTEVMRRERVMAEILASFKHKVGDEIEPANQQDFEKYGKCTIMGICDQYIHLGRDFKWPKNDNPMLVTASSESGEIFYATTNYFK